MTKARIELPKQLYLPGEEINGTVEFSLDKPVSQRSATLCLTGKERTEVIYTTMVSTGRGTQTQNRTAVQETEFLHQETPVPLPIGEKGKFVPGDYNTPFKFTLPPSLPMTYKSKHVKITYAITAKIDVPLGFDIKESSELYVLPSSRPVSPSPVSACSDSWNEPKSAGISLALDRCDYLSGETVTGNCSFKNPNTKNLRKIDVNLRWIETATAQGHTGANEIMKTNAKVPVGGRLAKGENRFSIEIPKEAPMTFETPHSNIRCTLGISLDIAFGGDVAAKQDVRIVGRVGEERVVPPYAPETLTEPGRITERQGAPSAAGQRRGVFCHSCGAYIGPAEANYCPFCGANIRR
jgi:hypothetical protein